MKLQSFGVSQEVGCFFSIIFQSGRSIYICRFDDSSSDQEKTYG